MRKLVALLFGFLFATAAAAQTPAAPAAPALDLANVLYLDLSTGGRVGILMRPDKAPTHVERIKTLARRGFYDGLIFHRVIDGFMAQGGDPKGEGSGGSDLPDLKAEFNDIPHMRGVASMARAAGNDSANSQFFIMLGPNFVLDNEYTAWGRVFEGMEYVDAIEKGEPPANPSKILKASIGSDNVAPPAKTPPTIAVAPVAPQTPAAPAPAAKN
ncbi:peptidylprolyl isomerase [Sphingoaurantiacus capsulatus]|uniref:Peptidyl-prolyl cis-trans isomerase n=1 Tax=Sphingoaurantiacus capsulatus TaxID=1771310 RepID=A0ABV7X9D6_9SPHN